jgi:hypothetical protein
MTSHNNSSADSRHLAKLVYEAMRFAVWAAGQGLMAQKGEPTLDPEDFLFDYSKAMDIDDWDGLPEVARDAVMNAPAQPARRGSMAAQFTYDPEGEAYYFAPLGAQPGPYYTQRHVDAILNIAFDGTLAGVELIDRVPPPPCLASQPSPAATVETSQFETTKAGVIDWKMEAERANRLLAQAERPKCRLCGLEDGACICAHLPPRLSAGSDAANALAKRLHHAAVTMQNDDISEPQSEKRRRHIERYETLIDAVDYLSAQPQGAQDPTVWLVEWPESDTVPVRWWNPAHGWMRDANAALHFARKTDADCYLSTMKIGESLKVAEHKFVTSPLSRPQSGGK